MGKINFVVIQKELSLIYQNTHTMTTRIIINQLQNGVTFENQNTQFFTTKDGMFLMCEFTKDCKYTRFTDIEKFAKRILKFYKTGY